MLVYVYLVCGMMSAEASRSCYLSLVYVLTGECKCSLLSVPERSLYCWFTVLSFIVLCSLVVDLCRVNDSFMLIFVIFVTFGPARN